MQGRRAKKGKPSGKTASPFDVSANFGLPERAAERFLEQFLAVVVLPVGLIVLRARSARAILHRVLLLLLILVVLLFILALIVLPVLRHGKSSFLMNIAGCQEYDRFAQPYFLHSLRIYSFRRHFSSII